MAVPTLQELGINRLTNLEKIELIGLIWDSIPPNDIPIPDWHREILEERLAEAERNPGAGSPWEEVEARLLKGRNKIDPS